MKCLKLIQRTVIATALVFSFSAISAPVLAAQNTSSLDSKTSTKNHKSKITTKKVSKTQVINFQTQTQNDSTLDKGTTKVIQTGKKGEKKLTYKVTYKNGKEVKRQLLSQKVLYKPVAQIVAVGIYVAPAVAPIASPAPAEESPTPEPSPSAGPTAQCVDGSYSYSAHRSGTCSHHGGVATWF